MPITGRIKGEPIMRTIKSKAAFDRHIKGKIGQWTVRAHKNGLGWIGENWTEEFFHNGELSHMIEHNGADTRVLVAD